MKKAFIFLAFLLLLQVSTSGQCCVFESFEGAIPPTTAGLWKLSNVDALNNASIAKSGNYCVYFNAKNDSFRTPRISRPVKFSINYKASNTSNRYNFTVQFASDTTTAWTLLTPQSPLSFSDVSYTQSTYLTSAAGYVRIIDNRTGSTASSATDLLYIDNISWSWDTASSIWRGDFSNSWADAANWCNNSLPTKDSNVLIPSGMPNICYIFSGDSYAKKLTIQSNPTPLLYLQGGYLHLSDTLISSNGIQAVNGYIDFVGPGRQIISGSNFKNNLVNYLKISNPGGVILGGTEPLRLGNTMVFGASNCTLNSNGNLVIASTSAQTARVADFSFNNLNSLANQFSGNRIIGNVTVERFIPSHPAKWQFLAVPTAGQTINATWQEGNTPRQNSKPGYGTIISSNLSNATSLGFDTISSAAGLKYHDSLTGSYIPVTNTATPIKTSTGYMLFVRGDRSVMSSSQTPTATTLRTFGSLYTPLDNPPPVVTVSPGKFRSVNNFYPSAINFAGLTRTGTVKNTYYVWDPALTGTYGIGQFQTFAYNGSGYTAAPGGGEYLGNTNIESGSAFFVVDSGAGGTIRFNEAAKTGGSNLVLRPGSTFPFVRNNLSVCINQDVELIDGVISFVSARFNNALDLEDIDKINTGEGLGIIRNGKILTAEYSNNDTVFYHLSNLRKNKYRFTITSEGLEQGMNAAVLYDKYRGGSQLIDLRTETKFDFEVDTNPLSLAPDRFYLVLKRRKPVLTLPFSFLKTS